MVESPSADDFYYRQWQGQGLSELLKLAGIGTEHRFVIDKGLFRRALSVDTVKALSNDGRRFPVVHITAHGDDAGLDFTNGDSLTWRELRDVLLPLNNLLSGDLVVCMSSCKGWNACKTAMALGRQPYFLLVGSTENVSWSESSVGFVTFYHQFASGVHPRDMVAAMKTASQHAHFAYASGKRVRAAHVEDLVNRVVRQAIPGHRDDC